MRCDNFVSFPVVAGYLFCIILSAAMALYLIPCLMEGSAGAWLLLALLVGVTGYALFRLAQDLFPARLQKCPVCAVVRGVVGRG